MSNRTQYRASLLCKIFSLVCLAIVVVIPIRHSASAQRGYAATAEDQRRDDSIDNLRDKVEQNAGSNAKTWAAINEVKAELHQMEVDQASTKFVTTGVSGTGLLGLLVSIALQVRKKPDGKDGQ